MHHSRTGSPGGPYASPPRSRHNSNTTNFSRPATASTSSAAQYTKALLSSPPPLPKAKGGTPKAPSSGATGTFARPPGGVFDEADSAQYTFYREGTPTPSERSIDTRWEKRGRRVSARVSRRVGVVLSSVGFPAIERGDGGAGGAGGAGGLEGAPVGFGGDGERAVEGKRRVCGIPMGAFWCLVIGVGMVIIGLAVGLGLGLGLDSGDKAKAEASEPTTTTSTAHPTSTPDTQPITADISCPASDNNRFLVPSQSKSFVIHCGIDYVDDTEDLSNEPARDMEECVAQCAGEERCTACGWGYIGGDKGKEHQCWLKGKLGGDHEARANWTFAILER